MAYFSTKLTAIWTTVVLLLSATITANATPTCGHLHSHLPENMTPTALSPGAVSDIPMIELVLTACQKEQCQEFSLFYDPYRISLMTCMIVGQQEAARWKASHPKWEIKRWSCRLSLPGEEHV
ncbi:hypothetical protein [Amaricoccus tamworthensis]|uniref:hypothetical protein n=1 Tax=Amaricoccus tamworthensis TaxID=57002 RepID=UPI003C7D8629